MSLDINLNTHTEKYERVRSILKDTKRKFIIIDGVIGAGKTTLISLIEKTMNDITYSNNNILHTCNTNKQLKVKAIYEPVDLWNTTGALQYFYQDIPKHCLEFQNYTYSTRIDCIINEIYACPDADIYILERSIWTDKYIFMELLRDVVGEMRMTMYNQWCDMWAYVLPMRVDKWVLLNTSLQESLNRIMMRNRNGETDGITVEYQTNLYKKHIEFYEQLGNDNKPVVIIESKLMDVNLFNDDNVIADIIKRILE